MRDRYVMEKNTLIKTIIIALTIIFSAGISFAENQSIEKKINQQNLNKNDTNSVVKGKLNEQETNEGNDFSYEILINLFGIVVSATIIIWQIRKQHKNNYDLQRENHREKIKLEIYSEYKETISKASDKVGSAGNKARSILTHFDIYVRQISKGIKPLPINDREIDFRDLHFAAIDSITTLISLLEEYEIINPDIKIFKTAFSCASYEMSEALFPFQAVLIDFLPCDVSIQDREKVGTDILIPKAPSQNDFKRIKAAAEKYIDTALETNCYILDLAKEAQKIFLGNLFPNHLLPRKPLGPKYIVISTEPENVKMLNKYFFEETEWSKITKKAEDEARHKIIKSNP